MLTVLPQHKIMARYFMRKASSILLLSLFMAGCATSDQRDVRQRLASAEQSQQALELRLSHIEERLSHAKSEPGDLLQENESPAIQAPVALALEELLQSGTPVPKTMAVEPARVYISPTKAPARTPTEAAPLQETDAAGQLAINPVLSPGSPLTPELAPLQAPVLAQGFTPVQQAPAPRAQQNISREKSSYDAALALYFTGEFTRGREAFQAFLHSFPNSAFAPNALYWEGECLYALGMYDQAILLFQSLVIRFPKHHKAASALLKIGYSYERLMDMDNARFYWQILLDDFPTSAPAVLARQRMGIR
jgi:tol-pal system protein YbgF